MSKEKTVCPSQVFLEKTPSQVVNNLFDTGVGIENDPQQVEEAKGPKQSLCKRPKTKAKSGATSSKRNRPAVTRKKVHPAERDGKPAQKKLVLSSSNPNVPKPARSMTIVGTALTPRPRSASQFRETCVPTSPCAKPSSLVKTPTSWEVDNGKKACILTAIKPCNVDKEKIKFFKSDFTYNPKFEYSHPVSPLVLVQHNSASDRFLTQVSVNMQKTRLCSSLCPWVRNFVDFIRLLAGCVQKEKFGSCNHKSEKLSRCVQMSERKTHTSIDSGLRQQRSTIRSATLKRSQLPQSTIVPLPCCESHLLMRHS